MSAGALLKRVLRVERHALGPRCFVLGRRIHEWHAGGALLLLAGAGALLGLGLPAFVLGGVGGWLVLKDANDLVGSRRDTTAWSFGLHRPPLRLRTRSRAEGLPRAMGLLTAAVGLVNIVSALTPELPGRLALLGALAPHGFVIAAHAAVLPAGLALMVLSVYLGRRRRRALWLAVATLVGVGGLELLKGLDVEEALISWALAALLTWGRAAFTVRHDERLLTSATRGASAALAASAGVALGAAAAGGAISGLSLTPPLLVRETLALLTFGAGPVHFAGALAWLPLGIGLVAVAGAAAMAWALLRPRQATGEPGDRAVLAQLLRRHGHDTLSAFKLRGDLLTLVAEDGRAFLGYRVERGVLCVAGDPVGAPDAVPALLHELTGFAAERGLRIAAIGASESFALLARDAGLRALYLGDEAIVATQAFSLDGRPIKKVRQAVNRLERSGYRAEMKTAAELVPADFDELEAISERWRGGAPERGFSMAMDAISGEHLGDSVVLVARDADGQARGFLHFVPAYGRPVMSLSAMRRDRDTPNGLTEFMIVRAIQGLSTRGVEEVSLNFAAFARWLHHPGGSLERALARVIRRANPFFQIESLYTFNAKFFPRWQPRYLLHEGLAVLPRTALAALWLEGQIPRPSMPWRVSDPVPWAAP